MGQQSTGGVPLWKHDVVVVTAGGHLLFHIHRVYIVLDFFCVVITNNCCLVGAFTIMILYVVHLYLRLYMYTQICG